MRAFFYSTFMYRNGQNAIPSILLPGAEWTECCEWKSKMGHGWRRDKRCRLKCAPNRPHGETIRLNFWMQWNIASYFFLTRNTRRFQWYCFLQEKGNLANDCRGHEEKWLLSIGNKLREQVQVPFFFVPKVRRQQQQSGRHICCAMFPLTGPCISYGRFFSFYARNPNYSEHSVPNILITELWIRKSALSQPILTEKFPNYMFQISSFF